jgi:glutamate 5-kinase
VVRGESVGTLFVPRRDALSARKRWIAFRARSHGSITVDEGAKRAILDRGASLLPAGIVEVTGRFDMGDRVDIRDAGGATFAVGLVSYDADEIRRMKGRRQREFKSVLGYEYVSEIVDRDDLVVTTNTECRMANDE